MQIKLKQGFGRAIRTETDTCVVAILDERSAPGQRHFEAMRAALPEMRVTESGGRGGVYLPSKRQRILQGGRAMSKPKGGGQTVELSISGHQVRLSFAQERNPAVAQRVRVSLIDSYIRRHGNGNERNA